MDQSLPDATSSSAHDPSKERRRIRRIVAERGLCGLANDTKWDEFISAMREHHVWYPTYRFKLIDGTISRWDTEWFYHLPFPFIAVEWFDVAYLQETREHRLPPRIQDIDHSKWIEELLKRVGLDYRKGDRAIRVFGYSPKDLNLFDQ